MFDEYEAAFFSHDLREFDIACQSAIEKNGINVRGILFIRHCEAWANIISQLVTDFFIPTILSPRHLRDERKQKEKQARCYRKFD